MVRIAWGQPGERFFEAGVDRGVFYPKSGAGVPWNGLVTVDESSSGGDHEPLHFDGVKYLDILAAEDFVASVEAYTAPQGFAACEGQRALAQGLFATQQPRETFGFSYRSGVGNDISERLGYKIHLVYNATALPATVSNKTIAQRVDPSTRQWSVETVPPLASTYKPTAHLVIHTLSVTASKLAALEAVLYGDATNNARLPTQAEVITLLS